MITNIKSNQTFAQINHSDWAFLPNMLSGTAGIILGYAIAFLLGWI
ncbi:MAG: hypothetical protein QNJ34_25435 [Xenococcaceae cyanobacterium MO_188.B29]|nr:hypothetical protein [Xenococcaceae cyanobacterium MO_188.B29]